MADGAAAGENLAGALLHGDDRRLVEHQPFADQADQRIGRSQIDGQIATEVMKQVLEHPCSRGGQRLRVFRIRKKTNEAIKGTLAPFIVTPRHGLASELYGFMYKYRNKMATSTATNANAKRIV